MRRMGRKFKTDKTEKLALVAGRVPVETLRTIEQAAAAAGKRKNSSMVRYLIEYAIENGAHLRYLVSSRDPA